VRTIQFVLYLYNKDSARLYFDVWKHVWVVCHGKPKTCIVGTTVCVEDKEHVFPSVEAYLDNFPWKTRNRLATAMQFRNILWLVIYIGQGKKKLHVYNYGWRSAKVHVFCLSSILFVESFLVYVHIACSPVHTNFHSCSLYFVRSRIQTNKIAGENDGVLTASVEEDIERWMLVLLFHIALFCISFIVCICVHLFYYMYMLCALLHGNLCSLHVFLHTNLLHVRCVFVALLHLNK
jgi:hypothetical protein